MPVWFTRARHPQLPSVVMPSEAVEHYPGWVAYGEASTDIDALNAALFRETRAANDPAFATPPVPAAPAVPSVSAAPAPAATPVSAPSAPAGAAPKEQ